MRLLIALLLLSISNYCLCSDENNPVTIQPVLPDWVIDEGPSQVHPSGELEGKSRHYYLVDDQVLIGSKPQFFRRTVMQPLDPERVAQSSQIHIGFDPAYQTLQLHHINIWRDGKKLDKLSNAEIMVINEESDLENLIYDGSKIASIILSDIRSHDIIDYAYTLHGYNPIFNNKFSDVYSLGWSVTVDKRSVRITMPKNRPLQYQALLSDVQPKIEHDQNAIRYHWQLLNTESVRYESATPSWLVQTPLLQVSEFKSWHEVAAWGAAIFAESRTRDEDLHALIDSWKDQSQQQKIISALNFSQDEIRYLGKEIGIHSHKPHTPDEVLKNRYGDCKDKSLFLSALLNHIGIKATPALVSSKKRKAISSWLPTPQAFNHVIVKIETQDGEFWVDPTRNQQPGGLEHRYILDYGYALLLTPEQKGLTQVVLGNQTNSIDVTEAFDIDAANKTAKLVVNTRYAGPIGNSKKPSARSENLESLRENVYNYYSVLYKKLQPEFEVEFNDNKFLPEVGIVEKYTLESPWREGANYFSIETQADVIEGYLEKAIKSSRTQPHRMAHPFDIHYRAIVTLPEHAEPRKAEEDIHINNAFYDYHREIRRDGDQFIIDHFYKTKVGHIEANQGKEYNEDLNQLYKALTYWVSWKRPEYKRISTRIDRLRGLIEDE